MNNKCPPLISIVVAVFNGAETLQKCLDSIIQQSYLNKELIIIDGGSNDGTVELLKANNPYISYWISEPDNGIYNAWNKALLQMKGEWVCFLGADDFFWNNDVLAQMAEHLLLMPPDIHVVYGKVMLVNKDGENIYSVGEPWDKVKKYFTKFMSIPHPGTMHRHYLFKQHGVFDESFYIAGDYEFLLRELKTGDAVFIPDIITTAMRQGGISSTPKNILLAMWEIRRAQCIHGQWFPNRVWLMAMVRVMIRLFLWKILGEEITRKALDLGRNIIGLPAFWTKT